MMVLLRLLTIRNIWIFGAPSASGETSMLSLNKILAVGFAESTVQQTGDDGKHHY